MSSSKDYALFAGVVPSTGFHYCAIKRTGSVVDVSIDGVVGASRSDMAGVVIGSNNQFRIGKALSGVNDYFAGDIRDALVINGWSPGVGNFTPPERLQYGRGLVGLPITTQTIGNNATVSTGGAVDTVRIFDWDTGVPVKAAYPAVSGDWTADLPPGTYGISYFASGAQPLTHGPYTISA